MASTPTPPKPKAADGAPSAIPFGAAPALAPVPPLVQAATAQVAPAPAETTVLSEDQHEKNRLMLQELEMDELKRENARLRMKAVLTKNVPSAPIEPDMDVSAEDYDQGGDGDELILVEAIQAGMYTDFDNPNRPAWNHVQMPGRREEAGVRFPGKVFKMRREDVNTAIYEPGTGTGWVRVLRKGEVVVPGRPIGRPAPQTTQLGARVSAALAIGN